MAGRERVVEDRISRVLREWEEYARRGNWRSRGYRIVRAPAGNTRVGEEEEGEFMILYRPHGVLYHHSLGRVSKFFRGLVEGKLYGTKCQVRDRLLSSQSPLLESRVQSAADRLGRASPQGEGAHLLHHALFSGFLLGAPSLRARVCTDRGRPHGFAHPNRSSPHFCVGGAEGRHKVQGGKKRGADGHLCCSSSWTGAARMVMSP